MAQFRQFDSSSF